MFLDFFLQDVLYNLIIITKMLSITLQDPQNFQYASTVIKQSKTGVSSNRRLLVIKGGHLYYYSNVPKNFNGDPNVLEYFHQLPKNSIDVINIKRITSPSQASCQFSIFFDSKNLLEREDIRKTLTNLNYVFVPNVSKSEEVVWRFTCDTQYVKQKWLEVLSFLMAHFTIREKQLKGIITESGIGFRDSKQEYLSKSINYKNPWRQSTIERKNVGAVSMADKLQARQSDFSPIKRNDKLFTKSYSQNLRLQQFESSYVNSMKIEDAFTPTMKKGKSNFTAY